MNHIASFADRILIIDFVPRALEFKTACQKIVDSGYNGQVICPNGDRIEIKQGGRLAMLVKQFEKLDSILAA